MTPTILITGGLGYVGGRVASALIREGKHQVLVGTRKAPDSLLVWLGSDNIRILDLFSAANLAGACKGVDTIIHCAALNEIDCAKDPVEALRVNSLGTLNLIQAAKQASITKFIYFSTAHIYRAPLEGVIIEDSLPRPAHPYAITHKTAEDFLLAEHDKKTFTVAILRLSNSFGAPIRADVNRWSLVVNDLCRQAITDRKLVLKSSGLQQRDFITLADVENAVKHVLSLSEQKIGNGIFNLGGENSISIYDIAQRIASRCKIVLGYTPEIIRPEPQPTEFYNSLDYKIAKLKATGFHLIGNIDQAIDDTLLFCKEAFGESK